MYLLPRQFTHRYTCYLEHECQIVFLGYNLQYHHRYPLMSKSKVTGNTQSFIIYEVYESSSDTLLITDQLVRSVVLPLLANPPLQLYENLITGQDHDHLSALIQTQKVTPVIINQEGKLTQFILIVVRLSVWGIIAFWQINFFRCQAGNKS